MTWQLWHNFVDHPCTWPNRSTLYRALGAVRRPGRRRPRPAPCRTRGGSGAADAFRDGVTTLLARRGIDYAPTSGDAPWLWCLGGTSLYRDHALDTGSDCVDLNLWVCCSHRIVSADLWPYDLVAETGGSGPGDPRQSVPVALADDTGEAVARFLELAEAWLDEILVLSG